MIQPANILFRVAFHTVDFLDVVKNDFTIISSAHWPARFGYQNNWQIAPEDWKATDVFLARIPTPDGSAAVSPGTCATRGRQAPSRSPRLVRSRDRN